MMRVEISHKFTMGFVIVIGSVVLVNLVVPHLGIPLQWQQLFTIGVALLIGLLLGWIFSKAFTANIRQLTQAGERLSECDLSQDIDLDDSAFPDETSDLASAMNHVQQSLRKLVGDIRGVALRVSGSSQALSVTSMQMTASSTEVARTVDQISKGAETQAEMVEESNRLFKEMAMSIDLVAASAKRVAQAADETNSTAQQGGDLSNESREAIRQVLAEVESNGQQMVSFIAQVQKIGKIVEVINGIAQKTNLLALNATIEAARAGEYGRGFAVVAEEVRKLADSTTASADEITSLVEGVRDEGQRVQGSMAQIIEDMEAGREAVDRTNQAFGEITRNADNTRTKANSIVELTDQQISGADRISKAIEEIDKVVSDNAAATQQVSAATQEQSASMEEMALSSKKLSAMSEELLTMVKQFKLVDGGES